MNQVKSILDNEFPDLSDNALGNLQRLELYQWTSERYSAILSACWKVSLLLYLYYDEYLWSCLDLSLAFREN